MIIMQIQKIETMLKNEFETKRNARYIADIWLLSWFLVKKAWLQFGTIDWKTTLTTLELKKGSLRATRLFSSQLYRTGRDFPVRWSYFLIGLSSHTSPKFTLICKYSQWPTLVEENTSIWEGVFENAASCAVVGRLHKSSRYELCKLLLTIQCLYRKHIKLITFGEEIKQT